MPRKIRVTRAEIAYWLATVPRIDPSGPRAAWYVRAYNVREKIRREKLSGRFCIPPYLA